MTAAVGRPFTPAPSAKVHLWPTAVNGLAHTDPTFLDVASAVEALPELGLGEAAVRAIRPDRTLWLGPALVLALQ